MIIGVCGYGYSGSGAYVDLIRGWQSVKYFDFGEFNLSYVPDGLEDLRHHLFEGYSRFQTSDVALYRFAERVKRFSLDKGIDGELLGLVMQLTEDFVEEITQVKWQGFWAIDYEDAGSRFNQLKYRAALKFYSHRRRLFHEESVFPDRTMRLSVEPDRFDELAKQYVSDYLSLMGCFASDIVLVDQPFSANNPAKSFIYYEEPRAILVDRDPRDVFILAKSVLDHRARWIPAHDVGAFVEYYKLVRKCDSQASSPNIIACSFEDAIYKYEETKSSIASLLGLDPEKCTGGRFDPKVSINNTQLFRKNPGLYKDEIEIIERELADYLYDFDAFDERPTWSRGAF